MSGSARSNRRHTSVAPLTQFFILPPLENPANGFQKKRGGKTEITFSGFAVSKNQGFSCHQRSSLPEWVSNHGKMGNSIQIGGVTLQPLFSKTVLVWRIRLVCITAAGLFLCGVLAVFSLAAGVVAGVILLCLFLVACFWYCPRRYRSYRWKIDETNAQIHHGVFFHIQRTLPLSQVQYAELLCTPAQRLCGASTLILHAAGANLWIDGLSLEEGRNLWNQINRRRESP